MRLADFLNSWGWISIPFAILIFFGPGIFRPKRMAQIASKLGFVYWRKASPENNKTIGMVSVAFPHIFQLGSLTMSQYCNVMEGNLDNHEIAVFDYSICRRYDTNSMGITVTCVAIKLDGPLPAFKLKPKGLRTIFESLGRSLPQEIIFENYPEFSKRYKLSAEDVEVRSLFSVEVLEWFKSNPEKWFIDVSGNFMLLRKHAPWGFDYMNPPRSIADTLHQAHSIWTLFRK